MFLSEIVELYKNSRGEKEESEEERKKKRGD